MEERPKDDLALRIEDSVVTVNTPNEQVFGEVRGERTVRVWFAPGHYERVSTSQLQNELSTVARLLFAAARQEHASAVREITGRVPTKRIRVGLAAEYGERLAQLAVEAESDDGTLRVSAVGQQSYTVQIAPGTLDRLSREQFAANCTQAADRLLAETEYQAAKARWEVYDPLPGLVL